MRYGICTTSDHLADAQAAGYDFAELMVAELLPAQDEAVFTAARERLLASPIPIDACNCFLPGTLKVVGPAVDLPTVDAYMATALRRASKVGVKLIVFGSGGARKAPEGFPLDTACRQFVDIARQAAEIAAHFGLIIAIEPLNAAECNVLTSVAEGMQLVTEIDHPHLQLLADLYHMDRQAEPFTILPAVAPRLVHVHLDSFHLPALQGGREYDTDSFFGTLARCGYQGRLSLEDHSNFLLNAENGLSRQDAFARQLTRIKLYWQNATVNPTQTQVS